MSGGTMKRRGGALLFLAALACSQLSICPAGGEEGVPGPFDVTIGSIHFDLNALIEEERLCHLNREELSILRNAVFAKHGYIFRTAKFKEIFSSYGWYRPAHDDVSGMLTWIDLKNIEMIRTYEIGRIVFSTSHQMPGMNGVIKIEFYLRGNPSYADCSFTGFKIFEVIEGSKKKVFDSNTVDGELCVQLDSMEHAVRIEDSDGDGSEEFYFDVSGPISPVLLIVGRSGGRYVAQYHEPTFDVSYKDVDGDGVPELLSDHLGGGGFVSWWQGLILVNVMKDSIYTFSYELTRSYYEEHLKQAEAAFSERQDAPRFARLLNAHADLGNYDACTTLVHEYQELAGLDRTYYEAYINGPDEDLIGFTVSRAAEYERIWTELKH